MEQCQANAQLVCSLNEQADTCIDKQQKGEQIGKKVRNQYLWESKF